METVRIINKQEHAEKGQAIYEKIKDQLEKEYKKGQAVVLEVDTGDYCVANTAREASRELRKRHPDKVFYAARIGSRAYLRHYW